MATGVSIPIFPLTLLPLPGELVPLHIFEPRYKQLLNDAEMNDIHFCIYFDHVMNNEKLGSCMKLESIIKRYPTGEADIIVKCLDVCTLGVLYDTFKNKLYPGGEVQYWHLESPRITQEQLHAQFLHYMSLRNITRHTSHFDVFQVANELNLNFSDRYKLLTAADYRREDILLNRVKFLIHVLQQEVKSKDVFHLN